MSPNSESGGLRSSPRMFRSWGEMNSRQIFVTVVHWTAAPSMSPVAFEMMIGPAELSSVTIEGGRTKDPAKMSSRSFFHLGFLKRVAKGLDNHGHAWP
jgi:hypothetical protein